MPKKKEEVVTEDNGNTAGGEAAPDVKTPKAPKADTIFAYVEGESTVKLAPQAQGILNIIKEAGTINRTDLVAAMVGVVTTRQPMGRILSYYQKKLVETGNVTMSEPEAAAAEVPAEPVSE